MEILRLPEMTEKEMVPDYIQRQCLSGQKQPVTEWDCKEYKYSIQNNSLANSGPTGVMRFAQTAERMGQDCSI